MDQQTTASAQLPLGLKVFLVTFSCVLVIYNSIMHGGGSLLYICNVALFLAAVGICLERTLLVSMAAVGVVAIQGLWSLDLLATLAGMPLVGMTGYMFSDALPVTKRLLSLFHAWLPLVLLFAVWRLGYEKQALAAWTVLAWAVLLVSYFLLAAPPAPQHDPYTSVNVNYVYGLYASGPQTRMPGWLWLTGMMLALPLFLFYPTHLVFMRWFSRSGVPRDSRGQRCLKSSGVS